MLRSRAERGRGRGPDGESSGVEPEPQPRLLRELVHVPQVLRHQRRERHPVVRRVQPTPVLDEPLEQPPRVAVRPQPVVHRARLHHPLEVARPAHTHPVDREAVVLRQGVARVELLLLPPRRPDPSGHPPWWWRDQCSETTGEEGKVSGKKKKI